MSDKQKKVTRRASLCALLAVMAAVTGILEGMLPLEVLLPLPGVRLGLANVFVMAAFLIYGAGYGFAVMLARTLLVFLCTGNLTALVLSLTGGMLSLVGLCLVRPLYGRFCSAVGLSALSAFLHSAGQWLTACLLMSVLLTWYLPVLCAASVLTGTLTGLLLDRLFYHLFPTSVQGVPHRHEA